MLNDAGALKMAENRQKRESRKRVAIPAKVRARVFEQSRRRCCLCYFLDQDKSRMDGQIAHIDRNPANPREDNLVFLCLDCHNEYDGKKKQTAGITADELKHYRKLLYRALKTDYVSWKLEMEGNVEDFENDEVQELMEKIRNLTGVSVVVNDITSGSSE